MESSVPEHLFLGTVTIGKRGQVSIPAAGRRLLELLRGDKVMCYVHPEGLGVVFVAPERVMEWSERMKRVVEESWEVPLRDWGAKD